MTARAAAIATALLALAACKERPPPAPAPPAEAIPTGRLPDDVEPLSYELSLRILPSEERFSGSARIAVQLRRPRSTIWLHGRGLRVSAAHVVLSTGESLRAGYTQVDDEGVARLTLPRPVSGAATLAFEYDAPFDRQLRGLYRVSDGGEAYAFTQMQAISARAAFPSFDEPGRKTPFDLSLTVKREHVAIANTLATGEEPLGGGLKRVRFARTERLPTYLVAFAVGPLEIVSAPPIPPSAVRPRPLPLRGITAKGKSKRIGYSLAQAARILEILEGYFGIPYPYDKLDLLAVPDFAWGAMENAGAVTFREPLLLMDADKAGADQLLGVVATIAHEIAHQWFGNLVTMRWWDDAWLSEAFATWMGTRATRLWNPAYTSPELDQLHSVLEAMREDSLVSARQIRQPIESNHDIRNAFDSITYDKGAGVLAMFERYLGAEKFRAGVRRYLERFRHGTATADDFLQSLSDAAGQDVASHFRTFLLQPGVPNIEVKVACTGKTAEALLTQSRYLPLGSTGRRNLTWSVPVCLRHETAGRARVTCALLTRPEDRVLLAKGGCPAWVLPNADGAGYYRFSMEPRELVRLARTASAKLSPREALALADNLVAAFESGRLPADTALEALAAFARSSERTVAAVPMRMVEVARAELVPVALRPSVEAFAREIYGGVLAGLGLDPPASASGAKRDEERLRRRDLVRFLAQIGRDPGLRTRLRGRAAAFVGFGGDGKVHPSALEPDLVESALTAALDEIGMPLFDALFAILRGSRDATLRKQVLGALARSTHAGVAQRARALALDPALRINEIYRYLLQAHGESPENREPMWRWMQENFDQLVARLPPIHAGALPLMVPLCGDKQAADFEEFFRPRAPKLPGGPRNLMMALERIRLCGARVSAHAESARAFFERRTATRKDAP